MLTLLLSELVCVLIVLISIFFFTRLSADSPFHAEQGWEQDKNIKKGKIQFGHCYPGLSEGALNFMKTSLNNKSWWVVVVELSKHTENTCLHSTSLCSHCVWKCFIRQLQVLMNLYSFEYRGRPCAAECLQNQWLRAHRGPFKGRLSKVCFSTDKLKDYLKQKEEKRDQVRTKLQGPFFQ